MNGDPGARRITRRCAIVLGTLGGVSLLTACTATAPPAARPADAPKPTEAPKPAAETKPAAPVAEAKPPPASGQAEAAKPAGEAKLAAAAPAPAQKAPNAGTVTTINWITPAEVGLERDLYTGFYQDFEKQNPSFKVNVSFESFNDYPLKLVSIMAGGSIPDLIFQNSTTIHEYGARGALRDLNPYLERDKVTKDQYFPVLLYQLSDYRTHTKQWAVPKDSGTFGVYYNKDMFDAAGVPYPRDDWTFADFRETAKKLTVDQNGNPATSDRYDPGRGKQWGIAFADVMPTSNTWQGLIFSQAGPWFTDDFKQAFFDDPDHVDVLQQLADMRCKDRSMPLDGDVTAQGDPWRNGLVAMTIGHQSQTFFHKVEKKTFNFDITRFPTGKHGQITTVSCSSYSIPTKAAQPDAAWELLKHLTSAETQCKITSGKRFASSVTKCQDLMIPDDNVPAGFKQVLADPLMGRATVKTMPTMVPPFLNEMRQIWKAEYDPAFTCGGVTIAEAAKRVQPRIQELLDRAQAL